MLGTEPGDTTINVLNSSDIVRVKIEESIIESVVPLEESIIESVVPQKIRCPCLFQSQISPLIECTNPDCRVLQHSACVFILDFSPIEPSRVPPHFYCETCQIDQADPFWIGVRDFISPTKVVLTKNSLCHSQYFNTTIEVLREDVYILEKPDYEVQVWCLLLNDVVQFRMQWLKKAVLLVNGIQTQTLTRPGLQLLGPNGRDDGSLIKGCLHPGANRIFLSGSDSRCFVIGIRLVKRRTFQQVLGLIPRETEGEPLSNAIARVNHSISGGMTTPNEDNNTELQVIGDSVTVTLKCPLSVVRMKTAGRFKPCVHMACFDLETFIELNCHSKKWQCPICIKNYSWKDIIIDPYFNQILRTIELSGGADITEVEIKTNGFWRVKNKPAIPNLEKWHCPDGSLCADIGTTSSSANVSSTTTFIDPAEVIVLSSSEEEDED